MGAVGQERSAIFFILFHFVAKTLQAIVGFGSMAVKRSIFNQRQLSQVLQSIWESRIIGRA
jgi:hypothetical protein